MKLDADLPPRAESSGESAIRGDSHLRVDSGIT
jgi:hypothetical protein